MPKSLKGTGMGVFLCVWAVSLPVYLLLNYCSLLPLEVTCFWSKSYVS